MENIWENKDLDIEEYLKKEKYNELYEYITDNKNLLIKEFLEEDWQAMEKSLRFGNCTLSQFEHSSLEDGKDQITFEIGILMGMIHVLDLIQYEKKQNEFCEKAFKKDILEIKNLKEIMFLLYEKGVSNKEKICEYLKLSKKDFDEIFDNEEIILCKIIQRTRLGGSECYRLSDIGRRVTRLIKVEEESKTKEIKIRNILDYEKCCTCIHFYDNWHEEKFECYAKKQFDDLSCYEDKFGG